MSNNKQSSVDFLTMQLIKNGIITYEDLKQAKAMHWIEIVNAVDGFPIHTRSLNGNDYYNEIYGGNNESN